MTLWAILSVFEKLINLDEFLHHLKLESERYAAQSGKTFEVSMDELTFFISANFVMLLKVEKLFHKHRYAAQSGKTFEVSMDELTFFISAKFVMGYHKLPNLRSYWETGSPHLSINFVANVMTREKFKEILGNLHFSNNEHVVPQDHQAHDRVFKVKWLIDHLNEHFLSSMEPEVEQSVDEHMIKYKDRSIIRQHIKNKPIKWGFRMWYR